MMHYSWENGIAYVYLSLFVWNKEFLNWDLFVYLILQLQDTETTTGESEVKFQVSRDTLGAMLRSMAYIREQLSIVVSTHFLLFTYKQSHIITTYIDSKTVTLHLQGELQTEPQGKKQRKWKREATTEIFLKKNCKRRKEDPSLGFVCSIFVIDVVRYNV